MKVDYLVKQFDKNEQPDLELFLSYFLDKSRFKIKNLEISEKTKAQILKKYKKIQAGMPMQYALGFAYFYNRKFIVNKNVLIPRFDTEVLVETAIKKISKNTKVLDLCSGSGCIGITIGLETLASVTCVDISQKAINVAKKNAKQLGASTNFVKSDLFNKINKEVFDVIISNPPYITSSEVLKLNSMVKDYEPHLALDGHEDGLFFYKKIISQASKHLSENGLLIFEVGINQAHDVLKLMECDFEELEVIKDLAGIDRVCLGKKKEKAK